MNRIKKEMMKRGIKLEHQYECMPCDGIQAVTVDSERATVTVAHTGIVIQWGLTRAGQIEEVAAW